MVCFSEKILHTVAYILPLANLVEQCEMNLIKKKEGKGGGCQRGAKPIC